MQHPFSALAGEYARLWRTMEIPRARLAEVDQVATRLLSHRARYQAVTDQTGVPVLWLAPIHERESGADFATYLGNGQPLSRRTTIVPYNRGPFQTWETGALDALWLDNVAAVSGWTIERALYEGELWNGFGPRGHGIQTGYLWAGTQHYSSGKYVSDGKWDPAHIDTQLGIAPLMRRLIDMAPDLALPGFNVQVAQPSVPKPPPVGVGGGPHDTWWLQRALNVLINAGLRLDGSYGRRTRAAVMDFQDALGLEADGLAGSKTFAALEQGLGRLHLTLPEGP